MVKLHSKSKAGRQHGEISAGIRDLLLCCHPPPRPWRQSPPWIAGAAAATASSKEFLQHPWESARFLPHLFSIRKVQKGVLSPQQQDLCSSQKGDFFSHPAPAPSEPPRCSREEKGPGSILLLEDIKEEQTGAAQGGHYGPREHRAATELLGFGSPARWPRASPVPIRGWARGRK